MAQGKSKSPMEASWSQLRQMGSGGQTKLCLPAPLCMRCSFGVSLVLCTEPWTRILGGLGSSAGTFAMNTVSSCSVEGSSGVGLRGWTSSLCVLSLAPFTPHLSSLWFRRLTCKTETAMVPIIGFSWRWIAIVQST
jgi:hypothetical protein